MRNTIDFIRILTAPVVLVAILGLLAVTAFSGAANVPNSFVPGTVADANEVNANFAALRDAINANIPRRSLITYAGATSVTPATTGVYEKARVLGTFEKVQADTDILLTWNTHVYHNTSFANWQLRIDDQPCGPNNGDGAAVHGKLISAQSIVNVFAVFEGLATGTHEVSMWVRGNTATTIEENPGNYGRQVLVTEQFIH